MANFILKIIELYKTNPEYFCALVPGLLSSLYVPYAKINSDSNYENYIKMYNILDKEFLLDKEFEEKFVNKSIIASRNVEVEELLLPYFNCIIENIDPKNLNNLYANIQDLKIEKDFKILKKGFLGCYFAGSNKILYVKEKIIGHELLHAASACVHTLPHKQLFNMQVGFRVFNSQNEVGRGINEGYTDHLTEQLFNNHAISYNVLRKIAGYTEELIGKDKMQELYFNNNLLGLFKELQKFMTREDAIKFIVLQDSLLKAKIDYNIYYKKPAHEVNKILDKSFKQK